VSKEGSIYVPSEIFFDYPVRYVDVKRNATFFVGKLTIRANFIQNIQALNNQEFSLYVLYERNINRIFEF